MRIRRNAQGRRGRSRLPLLEVLENRRLLSGNVVVTQVGDRLEIMGDHYGNQIKVYSNGSNQVCVQGENYTQVNGNSGTSCFNGIDEIEARMNGGNDTFRAVGLCLSSDADDPDELFVDGGAGDDCVEVVGSTIESSGNVSVKLYGEQWNQLLGSTTGNDTIRVSYTNIKANGQGLGAEARLEIYGEEVMAGTVTGGNDCITVANSLVSATDPLGDGVAVVLIRGDQTGRDLQRVVGIARVDEGNDIISVCDTRIVGDGNANGRGSLGIAGDLNLVGAGSGTVGEGNDSISVTGTRLYGTGNVGASADSEISGDRNEAAAGVASVGGGNDSIDVVNAEFSATGPGDNSCALTAVGEQNAGLLTSVGVGDDSISLECVEMTAACGASNNVTALIFGELNGGGGDSGSGDDCISVTDSNFTASAAPGGTEGAGLQIFGDSPGSTAGCDQVVVRNVTIEADDANVVQIDSGGGSDVVKVEWSCFRDLVATLGSGNDDMWFNNNTFLTANLDGGPGFDRLFKSNNNGVVTHTNFEEVNGQPYP